MDYMHYSASYDVELAKEYGLEAAALFNKLVYLSKFTSREDGFCWKTAKELEDELGITKRQQERAVKILEDAGLIETKVTYIMGTLSRCKHFKLNGISALSESDKMLLSYESDKMLLSENNKTALSIDNNNTSNNLNNIYISPKAQKHKYGEYKHVLLTDAEYDRLISDYGKEITEKYIKKVDEYCEQSGKRYQNYNLAIRNTFMSKDGVVAAKKNNDPAFDPVNNGRTDF